MEKSTNLFIRACKSNNAAERLTKLYNMFYLHTDDENVIQTELVHILSTIVDKHCPMTVVEFLRGVSEQESYYRLTQEVLPDKNYLNLLVLISKIRRTNVKAIEGFITPCRFRQPNGEF